MPRESEAGVAQINKQQQDRALALLFQLIQQALVSRVKVTEIRLRIPMHGDRLGAPKGGLETESPELN